MAFQQETQALVENVQRHRIRSSVSELIDLPTLEKLWQEEERERKRLRRILTNT